MKTSLALLLLLAGFARAADRDTRGNYEAIDEREVVVPLRRALPFGGEPITRGLVVRVVTTRITDFNITILTSHWTRLTVVRSDAERGTVTLRAASRNESLAIKAGWKSGMLLEPSENFSDE